MHLKKKNYLERALILLSEFWTMFKVRQSEIVTWATNTYFWAKLTGKDRNQGRDRMMVFPVFYEGQDWSKDRIEVYMSIGPESNAPIVDKPSISLGVEAPSSLQTEI
jgi:hypothetical protein